MTNSITKKICIILSAAAAIAAFLAQQADAFPAASTLPTEVAAPSFTRVDTRSYRHCHYRPTGVYVDCYTREPGEAPAPRQHYRNSRAAKDKSLSHHHHVLHRGQYWRWHKRSNQDER